MTFIALEYQLAGLKVILSIFHRPPDFRRQFFEVIACLGHPSAGYFNGITLEAGDDEEVQVKDLLGGGGAVRQKEIDAVAGDSGIINCPADPRGGAEELFSGGLVHVF